MLGGRFEHEDEGLAFGVIEAQRSVDDVALAGRRYGPGQGGPQRAAEHVTELSAELNRADVGERFHRDQFELFVGQRRRGRFEGRELVARDGGGEPELTSSTVKSEMDG